VTVRPEEGLSRFAEALEMDLVADAVSGPGEVDPVFSRYTPEVTMIVSVLEADLCRVVVYVTHG